jgi:recombination protein RecA
MTPRVDLKNKRIRTTSKKQVVAQIKSTVLSPKKKTDTASLISSGVDMLDLALGGGYPTKRVINIVGDTTTGKTLLTTEHVAHIHHKLKSKMDWEYDDVEERYSFNTKKMYNFSIMKKNQENSDTIEDFEKKFRSKLEKSGDKLFVYVLDSFDMLGSEAEQKRDKKQKKEKGTYNLEKQKELGVFFRTRKKEIKKNNCMLFIISQVRVNIGIMFGAKYYRTGGKALDHMASVILWLAEVEKHKKKGRTVGVTVKARITKVGNDRPFRECYIDIIFDYGVDNISSNLCFLYDLRESKTGKLKKEVNTEKKIIWDDEKYTLRGLMRHIENNNLEQELKQRCSDKWEAIEESIRTKRKSKYE